MKIGIANHTHAKVEGVDDIRVLKLLGTDEAVSSSIHPYWRLNRSANGWAGGDASNVITIDDAKSSEVLAAGDVIRLRPGSSLVSVLWRRGAKSNTLFATERCNSLCLMCSQPPRAINDDWRIREMLEVIPLIDKNEVNLGITGGEPTLLGEGLARVLTACRQELSNTNLHILTNGRNFRNKALASTLISAGGDRATWAVPLYADVAEIHDEVVAAPGAFDETMDGLYELASRGAKVEIRVVLHALTIPRLRQLAAFIYRRLPFVEHIALMGLEHIGFAKANRDRLWIDPADYVAELSDAVFFLANRGLTVSVYNLQLCVLPRTLWPFARQSISEWKNHFSNDCEGCAVRDHCAGFFASAGPNWRSRHIKPLMKDLSNAMA